MYVIKISKLPTFCSIRINAASFPLRMESRNQEHPTVSRPLLSGHCWVSQRMRGEERCSICILCLDSENQILQMFSSHPSWTTVSVGLLLCMIWSLPWHGACVMLCYLLTVSELRHQATQLGVPVVGLSVKTVLERLREIMDTEEDEDEDKRRELLTSSQRVSIYIQYVCIYQRYTHTPWRQHWSTTRLRLLTMYHSTLQAFN